MGDPFLFDPMLNERVTVLKLDIGSGMMKRKDLTWSTVDRYVLADYQADMWDLPFEDNTVDSIWSSHALEHVPRAQVIPTLTEWYRVLRPGGDCTVQVPDMDAACRLWLEISAGRSHPPTCPPECRAMHYSLPSELMNIIIFGSQAHEGEFHKSGWNCRGLQADVESVGFTISSAEVLWTKDYNQYSIRVEATK